MADQERGGGFDGGWPGPPPPPPTVPYQSPSPPAGYAAPGYPPPAGYQPLYHPMAVPVLYQPVMAVMEPPKSKVAAALLAFFLGTLGVHNFYLGRVGLGVTQLLLATIGGVFTCGFTTVCVAIWAFVEFIVILCGGVRDRYGRPLA